MKFYDTFVIFLFKLTLLRMMKTIFIKIFVCVLFIYGGLHTPIIAQNPNMPQEAKSNARLNFFALFWQRLSVQYEYQLGQNGLNANGNYTFGGDRTGVAGGFNYRYYFSDASSSWFVGAASTYSAYVEKVTAQVENNPNPLIAVSQNYKFKPQVILGALQGGFRWNIFRIFNINARLAYGVPIPVQTVWQDTNGNASQPVATDKNFIENRFKLFSSWEGEFSFGMRF